MIEAICIRERNADDLVRTFNRIMSDIKPERIEGVFHFLEVVPSTSGLVRSSQGVAVEPVIVLFVIFKRSDSFKGKEG